MIRRFPRLTSWLSWIAVFAASGLAVTLLPGVGSADQQEITVIAGHSITWKLDSTVKTVSIANSDIADVVVAGPHEILINGFKLGTTTLVVWDQNDVSETFHIIVRAPFSEQKIELSVQLAEINHTKAEAYGLDFLFDHTGGDRVTGGSYAGKVDSPGIPLSIFGGQPVEGLDIALRWITGDTEVATMIRALKSSGVIRVLAEPNVVAASGEKANFLSGGEIPVPVASSGTSGGSTVTIEWKEFGVKVEFLPTIVDEGVISLKVAPEVSSLDFSNGIELSGFRIPALRSRKASTTVELRSGELLVIGGLILEEDSEIETRTWLLGDIPILGWLFRGKEVVTSVNELMLVVSPRIVRALPPGSKVPLPTDGRRTTETGQHETMNEEQKVGG